MHPGKILDADLNQIFVTVSKELSLLIVSNSQKKVRVRNSGFPNSVRLSVYSGIMSPYCLHLPFSNHHLTRLIQTYLTETMQGLIKVKPDGKKIAFDKSGFIHAAKQTQMF